MENFIRMVFPIHQSLCPEPSFRFLIQFIISQLSVKYPVKKEVYLLTYLWYFSKDML